MEEITPKIPKVFISYSWGNKEKVMRLADKLVNDGVNVVADFWDLKPGNDLFVFMEQMVLDPCVDNVLIICDKVYTEKANSRSKGVGKETMIITPELYNKTDQEKFIPVVFEKDEGTGEPFIPAYLKRILFHDLSGGDEESYMELLRTIHKKPRVRKPPVGKIPAWLDDKETNTSNVVAVLRRVSKNNDNKSNNGILQMRKFEEYFIEAAQSFAFQKLEDATGPELLRRIEMMKPLRDVYIEFLESIVENGWSAGEFVVEMLTNIYNTCKAAPKEINPWNNHLFEHYNFLLWEMIICSIATLYRLKRYDDIGFIASSVYFLRDSESVNYTTKAYKFVRLGYGKCRLIEDEYKRITNAPWKSPRSDILVKREKLPHINEETLSFADILLAQLSLLHTFPTAEGEVVWFAESYIYNETAQREYTQLQSKRKCESMLKMYGAENIENLKELLEKKPVPQDWTYQGVFSRCPGILSFLKPEDIGKLK